MEKFLSEIKDIVYIVSLILPILVSIKTLIDFNGNGIDNGSGIEYSFKSFKQQNKSRNATSRLLTLQMAGLGILYMIFYFGAYRLIDNIGLEDITFLIKLGMWQFSNVILFEGLLNGGIFKKIKISFSVFLSGILIVFTVISTIGKIHISILVISCLKEMNVLTGVINSKLEYIMNIKYIKYIKCIEWIEWIEWIFWILWILCKIYKIYFFSKKEEDVKRSDSYKPHFKVYILLHSFFFIIFFLGFMAVIFTKEGFFTLFQDRFLWYWIPCLFTPVVALI